MSRINLGGLWSVAIAVFLASVAGCNGVRIAPFYPPATHVVTVSVTLSGNDYEFSYDPDPVTVRPGDTVKWEVTQIPGVVDWEIDLMSKGPAYERIARPSADTAVARIRISAEPGTYKYAITVRIPNPEIPGIDQQEILVSHDPRIKVQPD